MGEGKGVASDAERQAPGLICAAFVSVSLSPEPLSCRIGQHQSAVALAEAAIAAFGTPVDPCAFRTNKFSYALS